MEDVFSTFLNLFSYNLKLQMEQALLNKTIVLRNPYLTWIPLILGKFYSSPSVQNHNLTSHLQYFSLYVVQITDNTYIQCWINPNVFLVMLPVALKVTIFLPIISNGRFKLIHKLDWHFFMERIINWTKWKRSIIIFAFGKNSLNDS